jgi:hypothetical protein
MERQNGQVQAERRDRKEKEGEKDKANRTNPSEWNKKASEIFYEG